MGRVRIGAAAPFYPASRPARRVAAGAVDIDVQTGGEFGSESFSRTDVIISPFGKCGTTWLQQVFHTLRTGHGTGLTVEPPPNQLSLFPRQSMPLSVVLPPGRERTVARCVGTTIAGRAQCRAPCRFIW